MKQQLWILNSSLVSIFVVALLMSQLLRIEPPTFRPKRITADDSQKKKDVIAASGWEKIYINDLFATYSPKPITPAKKTFTTPIPQPKTPDIAPPPELPKQTFIAPLALTIKGIIISADEDKSVAMIEDETKKEGLYHLGEKIKDAQIVKIAQNRIVFLRGNGQQEVFFLRTDDIKTAETKPERWDYIIKKIDDENYTVDPEHFKDEVETLGNFIERAAVVGTAFRKGKPVGLKVGALPKNDVGMKLGLQKNDILLSINDLAIADVKNRMKIFDTISQGKIDDTVKVVLKRGTEEKTLSYKFAKISKAKQKVFTGKKEADKKQELPMSRTQQREKTIREFKKRHSSNDQKQAIAKIRQRLLRNLRSRLKNSRVR